MRSLEMQLLVIYPTSLPDEGATELNGPLEHDTSLSSALKPTQVSMIENPTPWDKRMRCDLKGNREDTVASLKATL